MDPSFRIHLPKASKRFNRSIHIVSFYEKREGFIKACARVDSRIGAVHSIHQAMRIADEAGNTVRLAWVPGHAGVAANRMADSLARELLSCPSETRPQVPDDPYPIDPDIVLAQAKAARRAALRNILPENPTPLPGKFTRAEATRLRRIVTETAVTPARRAMMRLQTWQSATCRSCPGNQLPDQNHIL
ncbi:uncharacterized protein LOC125946652 [Dermacentor silvarum]|uniref:uncharacterized protein LOC125946652 n=1 Tax=Dermacentor silvarum TaxID=543639 RepID=UPI002100F3FB|nr:uncharacterized protein LOC125946652 [Dermacentor silvarum]